MTLARRVARLAIGILGLPAALVLLAFAVVEGSLATGFTAVLAGAGALLTLLAPSGRPRHPPSESTIQAIRRERGRQNKSRLAERARDTPPMAAPSPHNRH